MITLFIKQTEHVPKWFIIDAANKILGRLATEISGILRGKILSYYTPGTDQGNYIIVINSSKIRVTGKKLNQKLYYSNSQRPGSLKIKDFKHLQETKPNRILEKAVWGMLPKTILNRQLFKRLYIYNSNKIKFFEQTNYKNLNLIYVN